MRRRNETFDDLLQPLVQRARLTRREREALRRLNLARSARWAHGFDPLELRLGLRSQYLLSRLYYEISNPIYHRLLLAYPEHDDSLSGPAWLYSVYGGQRRLVVLPGVRALIQAHIDAAALEVRAA